MFPYRGKWEIKHFRKAASTVYDPNTLVVQNSDDDTVVGALNTSTSATGILGICLRKVRSSDSDYADNTRIPVAVPLDTASEMLCDTNSTLAITDEGELHDLLDSAKVNEAGTTNQWVKLKQFVSSTTGIYTINKKSFV